MDVVTETPSSRAIYDPTGVFGLLLEHGMTELAIHTAYRNMQAQGVFYNPPYVPTPEQAAKVRSFKYAMMGGKR